MCVVLAGWPGIFADLHKDNSGSSLKLSNALCSFWAAAIGKADGGRDGAATTVPPFVDPSGRNGNERRETEKFIWQIFIFVPLSLLSKSSFHLDRGREGKVNRIWPGCFLLTVMPRKGREKNTLNVVERESFNRKLELLDFGHNKYCARLIIFSRCCCGYVLFNLFLLKYGF